MENRGKMSTVMDKAKISGIVGVVGAFATLLTGYVNLILFAALGTFIFSLMIQYGAVKFKIFLSLTPVILFVLMLLFKGVTT